MNLWLKNVTKADIVNNFDASHQTHHRMHTWNNDRTDLIKKFQVMAGTWDVSMLESK